jgi:hypothetical protein
MAALFDYRYVVVSNEKSSNYGNVEYLGEVVNHQWSKSLEFEKLFQDYTAKFVTKDISYFSLLRPLSELKIVEIFAKYRKYFSVFSSCNTNFRIVGGTGRRWCGKCAKCIFVFSLLSAFVSKEEIAKIFGDNLYAKEENLPLFEELLGIRNFKPFECVGTPEEMKLAMYLAWEKEIYNNDVVMRMFIEKVLPNMGNIDNLKRDLLGVGSESLMPFDFKSIINSL